jgi:hypothetical protein
MYFTFAMVGRCPQVTGAIATCGPLDLLLKHPVEKHLQYATEKQMKHLKHTLET